MTSKGFHWEVVAGKKKLVFDKEDYLRLSAGPEAIPWGGVKRGIRLLKTADAFLITKADIEDAAGQDLPRWNEIEKALLACGAVKDGRFINVRDLLLERLGDTIEDSEADDALVDFEL